MTSIKVMLGFGAYRVVGGLLRIFIPFYLLVRVMRKKEEKWRWRERLGYTTQARPQGSLVWLHAASVGETMALLPIIERILTMQIHVLLTTGTVASAILVREHFGNRLIHQYVPLDLRGYWRRFLKFWRPDLSLVCESEIWPMRIHCLAEMQVPQLVLNARLSEKTYLGWQKIPNLARAIFSRFNHVICQTQEDALRYRSLGSNTVCVAGNLKADVILPARAEDVCRYEQAIGLRPRWAAISTHYGEELMAAQVHKLLRKRYPDLLTIIVPRHIERTSAIAEGLRDYDFNFVRKSQQELPTNETDILLGDTVGDMGFYLKLTQIAFIGKSLTAEGGHNPIEPALTGAAILSGPNIQNFKESYKKLREHEAVHLVDDAVMLAGYVHHLLEKPDVRQQMIDAGRQTALKMSGACEKSFAIIEPLLRPLTLAAQLVHISSEGNGRHAA